MGLESIRPFIRRATTQPSPGLLRFGPRCNEHMYVELRDGEYWCTRYDLIVPNGALCDDYEWDGKIRVT